MDTFKRWKPGDIVVMRGVLKGKLWWACPSFVVQDTPELLVRYWPAGTSVRGPVWRPTVQDEMDNRIELEDRLWVEHDILSMNLPGRAHSIDLMWAAGTHELRCWYVHLQEPLRRTCIGVDTMDQMLDIVISPDRKSWYWKDEDELRQAQAIGLYSPQKVERIWAEGKHVLALMEANQSPFCDGWEKWTPPMGWSIPRFPSGWEKVPLE